jgi:hypothetical protein
VACTHVHVLTQYTYYLTRRWIHTHVDTDTCGFIHIWIQTHMNSYTSFDTYMKTYIPPPWQTHDINTLNTRCYQHAQRTPSPLAPRPEPTLPLHTNTTEHITHPAPSTSASIKSSALQSLARMCSLFRMCSLTRMCSPTRMCSYWNLFSY